jgi:hypothetical protein
MEQFQYEKSHQADYAPGDSGPKDPVRHCVNCFSGHSAPSLITTLAHKRACGWKFLKKEIRVPGGADAVRVLMMFCVFG